MNMIWNQINKVYNKQKNNPVAHSGFHANATHIRMDVHHEFVRCAIAKAGTLSPVEEFSCRSYDEADKHVDELIQSLPRNRKMAEYSRKPCLVTVWPQSISIEEKPMGNGESLANFAAASAAAHANPALLGVEGSDFYTIIPVRGMSRVAVISFNSPSLKALYQKNFPLIVRLGALSTFSVLCSDPHIPANATLAIVDGVNNYYIFRSNSQLNAIRKGALKNASQELDSSATNLGQPTGTPTIIVPVVATQPFWGAKYQAIPFDKLTSEYPMPADWDSKMHPTAIYDNQFHF